MSSSLPPNRPGGYGQQTGSPPAPPPPNYNPNALVGNMQNLNIYRPPSMVPGAGGPGPRPPLPPPFAQQTPTFSQTLPAPSPPVQPRPPGPPPGAFPRPASGPPSSSFPPNAGPGRLAGPPPGSQPPPPFVSRPQPWSFPSSMNQGSGFPPPGGLPSGAGIAPSAGVRPGGLVSSSPLSGSSAGSTLGGPPSGQVSNGPPFGSAAVLAGPRFPPAGGAMQPPMGTPPTMVPSHAPPPPPGMRPFLASSGPGTLPGGPMQRPPPQFSGGSQGVSPPMASATGAQPWQLQTQQMAPGHVPGSVQPPRMYGMAAPLHHAPMGQTGSPLAGSSKIDPNQIPRPIPSSTIVIHETRQGNAANPPPPATSDYIVKDTGNCSPRYMRCTINQIPCTADLLSTSGIQLALLVQPLALPHSSEEPIQVVDFGDSGPVRCSRCKGYINPFMKFIDQGRRFICNLCGFTDETPRDYHCNLGPDGRRRDADERPELCRGTVEFVATKEFMVREPMPAVYFFLIDVSLNAIQTGATAAACSSINQVISDLPESPQTMVGIATFDSTIHFYNLKRALQQPLMLIVPDVHDVYTPLETDVVVSLSECRQHLELLLENIPSMFQNSRTAESAFGAAVKAAFLAIKSTGGKLLVFQSALPSLGIGSLSSREAEGRSNISAGEKEAHKLLQPMDKTFKTMATEFAEYQVCVDIFITTQSFVDIASISVIPRTTGGQVYYYYPFSAMSDPAKLYNDLRWNVTRPQGFEAVMRVRCSQGIQVQDYSGNLCKRIPTDIDLPSVDCDKTVMVTLKHDDKLQDGTECAFQCALLYTTVYGQRRIRVINLSLPCTNMLTNLFRSADLDTEFACFLKQAASGIPSKPLSSVREQVTELCVNILLSYRRFCASASSSGQLILPESLKLLPLYTLALMKSAGLRADGRIDDRSFWISYVSSLSAPLAIPLVYPRMVAIHDLKMKEEDGSLVPPPIPLSSEHVNDDGIYLLENGDDALIYVGSLVDSEILQQVFGISSVDEISTQFVLQQFDNILLKKLNDVLNEIRRQRCSYLRLKFCKKGDPSGMIFFSHMVEDKNASGSSYIEFLVHVHRQIQMKMS